jgi:hypothetical protein
LNKDADAHKKQWEYFSPTDKDLFKKNHTAAQYTYCKTLSSDQNAQVLTIDAAEHKKTPKVSLSLTKRSSYDN